MNKYILFGAGERAKKVYSWLNEMGNVIAIVDNYESVWGKQIGNITVERSEAIYKYLFLEGVKVVITPKDFVLDICRQLYRMGIEDVYYIKRSRGIYSLEWVSMAPLFSKCKYKSNGKSTNCNLVKVHINSNRVLIIAYYFPPFGGIRVQRTLAFVRYLREHGYEPIVITCDDYGNDAIIDNDLIRKIPKDITIIRLPNMNKKLPFISLEERQNVFDFLSGILNSELLSQRLKEAQITRSQYVIPDNMVFWAINCCNYLDKNIANMQIGVAYSTVPEWSPHLVGYYLKTKYKIPWVADYRDPWMASQLYIDAFFSHMTDEEVRIDYEFERIIKRKMDRIIVAGDSWKTIYSTVYNIPAKNIFVIYNGYDEDDFEKLEVRKEKNEVFTLCHNGLIANRRNPRCLLVAINELIEENVIDKDKIQIVFNGEIREEYKKIIDDTDKHRIIKCNGVMPYDKALQISYDADLLVVFSEPGEIAKYFYPAKFYEYLRLGRRILMISGDSMFHEEILSKCKLGANYFYDDIKSIKAFIKDAYINWLKCDNIIPIVNEEICRFERKKLTAELAKVFDSIHNKDEENYLL